jgi:hypothetical protein
MDGYTGSDFSLKIETGCEKGSDIFKSSADSNATHGHIEQQETRNPERLKIVRL